VAEEFRVVRYPWGLIDLAWPALAWLAFPWADWRLPQEILRVVDQRCLDHIPVGSTAVRVAGYKLRTPGS
jgi:hypothetical protein